MRLVAACALSLSISVAALTAAQAQISLMPSAKASAPAQPAPTPAPAAVPAPASNAAAPASAPTTTAAATPTAPLTSATANCANPNALGVARVVEIDTTGGPGFGFEHFKAYDFLRPGEVVLTFDDGPWPVNTPAVLAALAEQCTKAIFFTIGKHAVWHPEILKQVAAGGHTIGTHTWSHVDLTPNSKRTIEDSKAEIEKGMSATRLSLGQAPAPFFRFPALRHPKELVDYLGQRNVAMWSTDLDSFDFKMRKPEQVVTSVMNKLKKFGKGIILMHDFQATTAHALPEILKQLKAGGYKVVQVKAKAPLETLVQYDDLVKKEAGGGLENARPISSVVKTIEGE
ncbi:MAG: polysaccharide deacetylase family protein [Pseudorhodoplanes sp.]